MLGVFGIDLGLRGPWTPRKSIELFSVAFGLGGLLIPLQSRAWTAGNGIATPGGHGGLRDRRRFQGKIHETQRRGDPLQLGQWSCRRGCGVHRHPQIRPNLIHEDGTDVFTLWG